MPKTAELPEAWKPKVADPAAPVPEYPVPDGSHESLAALYSGFAFWETWRKVVLAGCRELIRASAAIAGTKLSEARIDDLARTHSVYLEFLRVHLEGRMAWEREVQKNGFGA